MNGALGQGPNVLPVQELESLRIRLSQLHRSLSHMVNQVQGAKLASWPGLQGQFNVLMTQLAALCSVLTASGDTLSRSVMYPLPNFPTTTQLGLLSTLVRKKNLPQIEEWIEEGQDAGRDIDSKEDQQFCEWAMQVTKQARENHIWQGFDTKAGLPEEEDGIENETKDSNGGENKIEKEEDNDVEMLDVTTTAPPSAPAPTAPGWTLEQTLVFLSKGQRP